MRQAWSPASEHCARRLAVAEPTGLELLGRYRAPSVKGETGRAEAGPMPDGHEDDYITGEIGVGFMQGLRGGYTDVLPAHGERDETNDADSSFAERDVEMVS